MTAYKMTVAASLGAELDEHLGYEKHDPVGRGSGNSRNGTTTKRLNERRKKGSSIMLTLYGFGSTVQVCRDQSELNMRTPTITL